MADFRPGTEASRRSSTTSSRHGHLIPSGEPGLYGRGSTFEAIRAGFDAS